MHTMNKENGFTLIELLIVVAIIGILSAVAITAYVGVTTKAARSEAATNLESLRLLEEAFFSGNNQYTVDHGVAGATFAIRDANVADIQTDLPAFRPGTDSVFAYVVIQNAELPPPPVAVPFNPGNIVAVVPPANCFVATATGLVNTRVDGDIFAIDCNNNKNW